MIGLSQREPSDARVGFMSLEGTFLYDLVFSMNTFGGAYCGAASALCNLNDFTPSLLLDSGRFVSGESKDCSVETSRLSSFDDTPISPSSSDESSSSEELSIDDDDSSEPLL